MVKGRPSTLAFTILMTGYGRNVQAADGHRAPAGYVSSTPGMLRTVM